MASLRQRIIACTRCPRLIDHCREVARVKKRMHRDKKYWGKPVPSFGVRRPRLLVVGLAPGAHGANRTGRVFTGDASGVWLYRAMHAYGFATQPDGTDARDGLKLIDAVINNVARCAPPGNRPTAAELANCRPFLAEELASLTRLRVVIALGGVAFDGIRRAWPGPAFEPKPKFAHGAEFATADGSVVLLCSYHPSQQNTNTGRLTRPMFDGVFRRARTILDG